MKAEIRFDNGSCIVRITDTIHGVSKDFGPYTYLQAEEIIRDYDRMRRMFLNE
jgi:hypothetical protein